MEINDGGPAFPLQEQMQPACEGGNAWLSPGQCGMSLRDYFAAQVISQCQITVIREEPAPDAEVVRIYAERFARTAYVISDAMLKARESTPMTPNNWKG